jgi:succinate dehydrogenase / fumarate reductase, membrane anchor subunit
MVKRVIVGAHYGLRDWLIQRVGALVMALYTLLFALILIFSPPAHYGAWRALFANQAMKLATFLFLVSLFLHAWIGMRDILMDYIKPTGLRLGLEAAVALALVAYAGWALQILWSA